MKFRKISVLVLLSAMVGAALVSCKNESAVRSHGSATKSIYHCPMHPTYTSDKPGDCPICGMRLVLIEPSEAKEGKETTAGSTDEPTNGSQTLPDRAPVSLSTERQQLIGVRTASVAKRKLENLIRASGRVAYDPDLYNAIAEHRQALQARDKVKNSPWKDVTERADALVKSSALRLRQMGLSRDQIQNISGRSEDPTNLLIGEKGDSVWVYAEVYEHEASQIKGGQILEVTSSAFPGRSAAGKVVAVDSILNPQTRTLRVRGEVPNPDGILKPEMYVDAVIHVDLGTKLAIPEEAVLKTGTRQIAFVESSPGQFVPREIKLGNKAEEYHEVLSGLVEGEKVVTSANFLIDSESRLKAALSGAAGGHDHD